MLLPNMTESLVNLSSNNHLGGRKAWVELKQEPPAQLSSVIKLYSLVLCFNIRITSLLILTLWPPLFAIPPLRSTCSRNPIGATLFVHLVMVLRLAFYGATMKPRVSCGRAHKVVLLSTCWYQGCWSWSIMQRQPMCYFLVTLSLIISPYHIRRSLS
jgi:hypothetical protein